MCTGLVIGLWVAGCVSIEQTVPPVSSGMVGFVQRPGTDAQRLESGRRVYLARCIGCHSAEPIEKYSFDQWRMILPAMAEEAKLNDTQAADLEAYVFTARRFLDAGGVAAGAGETDG